MSRTKILTPEVKEIIAYIKDRHKDWSHRMVLQKIPDFSKQVIGRELLDKEIPGHTKVSEYLTKEFKPIQKSVDGLGLDKPWSTISLYRPEYAVYPEALPYVLRVWAKSQMEEMARSDLKGEDEHTDNKLEVPENDWMFRAHVKHGILTIREAIWIGRLIFIFKSTSVEHKPVDIDELWDVAQFFANDERLLQITGGYSDDREILLKYWMNDAILYSHLPPGEPAPDKIAGLAAKLFLAKYPRGYKKGIKSENNEEAPNEGHNRNAERPS